MRQSYISVGLGISVSLGIGINTPAIAGDYFHILTSETHQDAMAIGNVISRTDSDLVFRPTRVLYGQRLPKQLKVRISQIQQAEALESGDAAVLGLKKEKGVYTLTSQAFEVDNSDPTQAKILSGPLAHYERFKFQWLINSCGSDRHYVDDGNTVWLEQLNQKGEKIGDNILIGVKKGKEWIDVKDPVCPPIKLTLWDRFLQFLTEIVAA